MEYAIAPLGNEHERNAFSCGEPVLDRDLHRYASQDIKRRLSRVFVATPVSQPRWVTGYYSLSAAGLAATDLPGRLQRRLPRYPLPVALIGRLAVDESHQGKGLGSVLLADALRRIVQASQAMAVHAVVIDALHDRAAAFYRHFGFVPLPDQPLKLFLPLDSVIDALDHRTRS